MANYSAPRLDDFKKPDGSIDWEAYTKAQVATGERCRKCGSYILFGSGYAQECSSCKRLQTDGEVAHESFIRCPACGQTFNPCGDYDVYNEGENDITCPSCAHEFTIETRITCSFTSPARLEDQTAEDEGGQETDAGQSPGPAPGDEVGEDQAGSAERPAGI